MPNASYYFRGRDKRYHRPECQPPRSLSPISQSRNPLTAIDFRPIFTEICLTGRDKMGLEPGG